MTKTRTLTYPQQKIVDEALAQVIVQDGEGRCHYADGRTDSEMAAEIQNVYEFPCTAAQISRIREAVYGRLRAPRSKPYADIESRLNARVEELAGRVLALEATCRAQNDWMLELELQLKQAAARTQGEQRKKNPYKDLNRDPDKDQFPASTKL